MAGTGLQASGRLKGTAPLRLLCAGSSKVNLPDRPQQSDAVARWQKSLKHAGGASFTNAGDGSRQPIAAISAIPLVDDPNSECEIEGLRCFDGHVLDPQHRLIRRQSRDKSSLHVARRELQASMKSQNMFNVMSP